MKGRDADEILQLDETGAERLFPEGRPFQETVHWFTGGNLEGAKAASG